MSRIWPILSTQAWGQAPHQRLIRRVDSWATANPREHAHSACRVPSSEGSRGCVLEWPQTNAADLQKSRQEAGAPGSAYWQYCHLRSDLALLLETKKGSPKLQSNFSFPSGPGSFPRGKVIQFFSVIHPLAFNPCLFKLGKGNTN